MIATTTPSIDGATIIKYCGIVTGEVVLGANFLKDMAAGFRDTFGGRTRSYEDEIAQARTHALRQMQTRAIEVGGNAVVGVKLDYETLGTANGMLMVTASGTAVLAESVPLPQATGQ